MTEPQSYEKVPNASVEQTERDASPLPAPLHKKRSAWEKLGAYNIAVLVIGTATILLAVGFLTFIWVVSINGTQSGQLPSLWKLIVSNAWVSRVITLCSILIRVATAAQLCVFAAILAALILERIGASAEDFPLLSMMRCANTGPQALIWNVLHTIHTGSQRGYSLLIILTILNALALQFTSTILLADLSPTYVVLDRNSTRNITFGMSDSLTENAYAGIDYWKTGPQTYPRFAEYKEKATNGTNYTDTGTTYRGFLPFALPNQRNRLRNYHGPMTVVDARVVCVRPQLSNLTINVISDTNEDERIISGTLDARDVYPGITTTTPDPEDQQYVSTSFNCRAPAQNPIANSTNWSASLCLLGTHYGTLLNGIIPDGDTKDGLPTGHTLAQLILNNTNPNDRYNNTVTELTELNQLESSSASWARFGNEKVQFDLSLCFFNPQQRDYEVKASSSEDFSDASAFWDISTGQPVYNSYWVRSMLDAVLGESTSAERGLLTLEPVANWTAMETTARYNVTAYPFIYDTLSRFDPSESENETAGTTYQFTSFIIPTYAIHQTHKALVQTILQSTKNPALALQALWTVLLQMSYYDFFNQYSVSAPASFGIAEQVNIPIQWSCFAGVMGILGLHFVLLIISLVMFVTRTEMSLLGNSWQAVSQVMSTDTAHAVHHAAAATDKEMADAVKESGIAEGKIFVKKSASSGRTEATSVVRRR
ncbi:hypothetical protein BKA66DRAFT_613341 [Pyrenochaeta sp. MPI-SDFR-AT-0127]|nr:hypothetical protein BKA66DRAFT_613341 [Pyrenochaeta sp. MPI-SDFR-AT-0127]